MKAKHILGISALLGALYLITASVRQAILINGTRLDITSLEVHRLSLTYADITLNFSISNITDFDVYFKNIEIDVLVNNKKVSEINKKDIRLLSGGIEPITAQIQFNPSLVISNALVAIMSGMRDVPIALVGHMDAATNYIFKNKIPVDIQTTFLELTRGNE